MGKRLSGIQHYRYGSAAASYTFPGILAQPTVNDAFHSGWDSFTALLFIEKQCLFFLLYILVE